MKKILIFSISILISCSLIGCSDSGLFKDLESEINNAITEIADQVLNVSNENDAHVQLVKTGSPFDYPDYQYGDVFDNFFRSPTWKYFETASEEQVVEFTGYCLYQETEVKACLQFILNTDEETFETGALTFNDVPQMALVTIALIETAFDKYAYE